MKTVIIHVVAYGLTYLLLSALFLGFVGIVNRLVHKPFLDRWKDRLLLFTIVLIAGWLLDMAPANLRLIVVVPAGLLLLAVVIWVFVRFPSLPPKRRPSDTSSE